jgi:hypothetical protein
MPKQTNTIPKSPSGLDKTKRRLPPITPTVTRTVAKIIYIFALSFASSIFSKI